jgi:hypothetical protein
VLTALTRDPYFRGGVSQFEIKKDRFLIHEEGSRGAESPSRIRGRDGVLRGPLTHPSSRGDPATNVPCARLEPLPRSDPLRAAARRFGIFPVFSVAVHDFVRRASLREPRKALSALARFARRSQQGESMSRVAIWRATLAVPAGAVAAAVTAMSSATAQERVGRGAPLPLRADAIVGPDGKGMAYGGFHDRALGARLPYVRRSPSCGLLASRA